MALRQLLAHTADDADVGRLGAQGGRAFASASLRPHLIAALAERDADACTRAHVIVAGDDRAARDLASDLRAWLAPRLVRYYPSRGVGYESHLRPPPHLVGLRMAALDALLATGADGQKGSPEGGPVVVVSAVALSEKVPDPALRPQSFTLRVGDLLDLDECAEQRVTAGYERFGALLELVGVEAELIVAAEEELQPALRDHWSDVCAAFADEDAHHLYVRPEAIQEDLARRARIWLSALASGQEIELRAQSADSTARSLGEAESELERLVRSGYRAVVTFPRRGEGERAAYNLAHLRATWLGEEDGREGEPGLRFAAASLREGFISPALRLAVFPAHRLLRRRRAERDGAGAEGAAGRGRRGLLRSFSELRTGDIVVHEDHGVARFAGFETRTVAGITRDYLYLEYQGDDRVFVPTDQLAKISRYVGAGGDHPPLSKPGGTRWETMKARARRAAQELSGELLSLYAERLRRRGHAFEPDGDWQREFEQRFPYNETPDQRDTIELVKADMEAPRPMDRLICGDVGYGQTEVALRAAFKSVQDGKQVMLLAPTTILAQQQYATFSERLKDYPWI